MDATDPNHSRLIAPGLVAGLALAVAGGCAALVGSADDGLGASAFALGVFVYGVPLVGWLVVLFVLLAEGRSGMIAPAMTTGAALGIVGAVGAAMALRDSTPVLGSLSLAMLAICGVGLFAVLRPSSVMTRSVLAERLDRSGALHLGEPGVAAVLMGALLALCAVAVYQVGIPMTAAEDAPRDAAAVAASADPVLASAPPYVPPTRLEHVRTAPLSDEDAAQVLRESGVPAASISTTPTSGLLVNVTPDRLEDTPGPIEIVFDAVALRRVVDRVRIGAGEYTFTTACQYYARPAPGLLVIGLPPAGCPARDDPPWAPARDITAALGGG